MRFFDRKEEVIDIQLTQYGKHLVSIGRFKPAQYAFFDDDIIYDGAYANLTENQNDIATRIKETPRLKTQYMFQSADKSILEARKSIEEEKRQGRHISIPLQPDVDKHYALSYPIGTSGFGNQYVPSWEITSYKSAISSSARSFPLHGLQTDEKQPEIRIPQINTDIIFRTVATDRGVYENFIEFEDGTMLALEEDYLLLEVFENNALTQNEEFELEVYQIETETNPSGSVKEHLIPLKFAKRQSFKKYIVGKDNKVVENPDFNSENPGKQIGFDPQLHGFPDSGTTEYFFDISLDTEIPNYILCKHKPTDKTKGLFTRLAYRCRGVKTPGEKVNIYENLEETEEICD